jgi:hypothetical protein
MALRFKDLTSQVGAGNTAFTVSPAFFEPGTSILVLNGAVQVRTTDYVENADGFTLNTTFVPVVSDILTCYYEDASVVTLPASITVAVLKSDYLFGLDLKDQFGNVMSDVTLGNKISIGIARIERELKDFSLSPKVIKSSIVNGIQRADGTWAVDPEPAAIAAADIFEDPYDYDVKDYVNWGFLILRRKPVISVERVRLIYPTGQEIISYPREWIKVYAKFGQIQIVPMAGSFQPLIGQGSMYLPLMSGSLQSNVPQLIHVDYTTGLTTMPDDLKDAIYKMSALEILKIGGQGKAPGIAAMSTGADGLSESTTLTQSANSQMFGPLIKQYEDDVKAFIKSYTETNRGIDFRVA